jgi:hypothetical protein
MKWFRSNIQLGARVALLALAVQFGLSFGHFHDLPPQTAPSVHTAEQQSPAPGPDSDRQSGDICAVCAVVALASAAVSAAPPTLPLPQASMLPRRIADAAFIHLHATRAAFQSRAPPLSRA